MTRTSGHDEVGSPSRTSADIPSRWHVAAVLLTPEDAAAALGIGRTRLYELLSSGRLASVQLGRSRRIPVAAIHEFVARLDDNVVPGAPEPPLRTAEAPTRRKSRPRRSDPAATFCERSSAPVVQQLPLLFVADGSRTHRAASTPTGVTGIPAADREPVGAADERRGSHHPLG
jgi:excisionase family DNA binding protein